VGKRLPGLKALVNNPYTPWQTVEMKDGRGDISARHQQPQFVQNWDASRAHSLGLD